jgi:hypothetical protein
LTRLCSSLFDDDSFSTFLGASFFGIGCIKSFLAPAPKSRKISYSIKQAFAAEQSDFSTDQS